MDEQIFATNFIGSAFKKMTSIEKWIRYVTAVVMIVVGIYLILRYIILD